MTPTLGRRTALSTSTAERLRCRAAATALAAAVMDGLSAERAPRPGSADLGARRGLRPAGVDPARQHGAQRIWRKRLHQEVVHARGETGLAVVLEDIGGQ